MKLQLSIEAGAEMKAGAQEAFYQGARIILGDRPIWITLQRTWNSMTIWQKLTLIGGILQAFFIKITPEEIEALKNGDLVAECSLIFTILFITLIYYYLADSSDYRAS